MGKYGDAFLGSALDIGSSFASQAFAKRNLQLQVDASKELTDYNAKVQDSYQRDLMRDSAAIQKGALQRAGLSAAALNGNFSSPSMSVSPGTSPSISVPSTSSNFMSNYAQAVNAESVEIENAWKDAMLRKELESMGLDNEYKHIQNRKEKALLNVNIETATQNLNNLKLQGKINQKQVDLATQNLKKLQAETTQIQINNKTLHRMNRAQLTKLKSEVYKLGQEGRYEKIVADLADIGILVNGSFMSQLASLLHNPNMSDSVNQITSNLLDYIGSLGSNAGSIFESLINGMINGAGSATKGAFKAILNKAKQILNP